MPVDGGPPPREPRLAHHQRGGAVRDDLKCDGAVRPVFATHEACRTCVGAGGAAGAIFEQRLPAWIEVSLTSNRSDGDSMRDRLRATNEKCIGQPRRIPVAGNTIRNAEWDVPRRDVEGPLGHWYKDSRHTKQVERPCRLPQELAWPLD